MGIQPGAAPPTLVGRTAEFEALRRSLADDRPAVVVGEAGVGKTTLTRAVLATLGRRRYEGGGFATLAWAPYLAFERALGRRLDGSEPEAVAREVSRLVGDGILFVDDLQWTAATTRIAVGGLRDRIGLVLGVRLGDPMTDTVLGELGDAVVRVDLHPLEEADAIELARRARPGLDPGALERIARRSGGNPLLIGELATGGEELGSIAAAVRVRLAALDEASREAMRLLGLAGHPLPATDLGPGAGRLVTGDLAVVDTGGRIRVRHDLLGEAAIADLDDRERRRLHARLAELVAADPGEAARHQALAGDRTRAHASALRAAQDASTEGERAAHLILAAETSDGPAAAPLRIEAANLLCDLLDPDRARTLVGDRFGEADPALALVEARIVALDYDHDAARAAVARGLAALRPGDPSTADLEIGLLIQGVRIEIRAVGSAERALVMAREAHALAERTGFRRAAALAAVGAARYLGDDYAGVDDQRRAMEMAFADGDAHLGLVLGNGVVFNLLKAARALEARAVAEDLLRRTREARVTTWERQMVGWIMATSWHAGELAPVMELAAAIDPEELTAIIEFYRTEILADLGRLDEARVRAERQLPLAKMGEYDLGEALWLLADVALLSGRWADTIAYADRHARDIPGAQHRIFIELPRAWARIEQRQAPDWPDLTGLPMVRGGEIELQATRAYALGRWADATELFEAAADAWAGAHARGEWRSRWAAADSRRRTGDIAGARTRLLALEERLERVGHVAFLARTRRTLRAIGERRAARTARVAGSTLTEREMEILGLSARGLADPEIAARLGISRWAVLRSSESAAAKLGAFTRLEAIARLGFEVATSRSSAG